MVSGPSSPVPLAVARIKRDSGCVRLENWHWRARIGFSSHGVQTILQVTEPAALVPIKLRLPPGWREIQESAGDPQYSLVVGNDSAPPGLERLHLLFRGRLLISAAYKLEPVLGALEAELDRRVGVSVSQDRLFIQAGAVGWRGRAIVVKGPAHFEISALVAALLRAGASYYSDRYAVLDSLGRIHPYPRPLWLRRGTYGNPIRYRPEDLGAKVGIKPLPLTTVVFASLRPGAQTRFFPVGRFAAAMELTADTLLSRHDPNAIPPAISKALARASILKGVCGEPEDILNLLPGSAAADKGTRLNLSLR